ncbi:MAG TPA: hypothetical protein DCL35_05765 [Candidatus Omnitrophica bacterium]|nr:hypothetical protein [Candidatus Omnitrophota bacterium]
MRKWRVVYAFILSLALVGCSVKPPVILEENGSVVSGKDRKGNIVKFKKVASLDLSGTVFEDPLNATALYQATFPMATTCITINTGKTSPRFADNPKMAAIETMLKNGTRYLIFTDRDLLEKPLKGLKGQDEIRIGGFELRIDRIIKPDGLTVNVADYVGKDNTSSPAKFLYVNKLTVNGKTYQE